LKDLKTNSSPDIKIFLIGNKCDLEKQRVIKKESGEQIKNNYELDFFMETSAKTGMNVEELFVKAAKLLFQDYKLYKKDKIKKTENKILLTQKPKIKKKSCC
jgi:GTPase SAR1 family protein